MAEIDTRSPYYPFLQPQSNYYDLSDTITLPKKIVDYLIDAPKGAYVPPDDNTYPRCRLWKYLYYDGENPLDRPLPTIEEKMSVLFDPDLPQTPPTEKGYRLFPQIFIKESQERAQTRLYVYLGRTIPNDDEMKLSLAVTFRVWTHYTYELNTHTDVMSRAFGIEQALIEAFHGVNMAGVGTFAFSRYAHPDCGSEVLFDGEANVGRQLTMALQIATTARQTIETPWSAPTENGGTIRWGG